MFETVNKIETTIKRNCKGVEVSTYSLEDVLNLQPKQVEVVLNRYQEITLLIVTNGDGQLMSLPWEEVNFELSDLRNFENTIDIMFLELL